MLIREAREAKNYPLQDNYITFFKFSFRFLLLFELLCNYRLSKKADKNYEKGINNWTREQFIAEINRLKAENEALKNNQTLTNSEQQTRLQQNQRRLEKLESVMNASSQPTNKPNNNYLTPLLIGGGILAVIGLVSVLVYKSKKNIKRKIKIN